MVATRIETPAHQPNTCFSIMPDNNRKKKMCHDQKIILLGNGGVGKTTLLHTMVSSFPMNGSDFRTKMATIDNQIVKLQLWDTADQEKFGAKRLPNSYYRNAQGALLVYDATNRSTFEAILQWTSELNMLYYGKTFGITLVATNADNNRIVSTNEGQTLATFLNAEYVECDVGCEYDVLNCFNALVRALNRGTVWTVEMETIIAIFKNENQVPCVSSKCDTDNQLEEFYMDNQLEESYSNNQLDVASSTSDMVVKVITQPLKSVLPIAAQFRRRSVQLLDANLTKAAQFRRRSVQLLDSNLTMMNETSQRWKRVVYVSGGAAFTVAFLLGHTISCVNGSNFNFFCS